MMNLYILLLRVLHIGAGVFWAGASWTVAGFLTPAVKATGQSGQQVMGYVNNQRRLTGIFTLAAVVNILSGLLLLWNSSAGLNPNWFRTGPGIALSLGALAGIVVFALGFFVHRPVGARLGAIGAQLAAGPPEPELVQEAGTLQARLESAGVWSSILLAIAVILMAAAEQVY
ncbi:MAG TPA: hypothetical protein VGA52_02730 [Anaerolineales bacterium]|jgi:hypothetical protein